MPKPRHAAALSYDDEAGGAPQVVAAGSGIVADSVPAAEYEETCMKLRPMLAGLGAA